MLARVAADVVGFVGIRAKCHRWKCLIIGCIVDEKFTGKSCTVRLLC